MALIEWPPGENGEDALLARSYGTSLGDLVVDFDRPLEVITSALLQVCLSRSDGAAFEGSEVAHWTILKRRQGLLAISAATSGAHRQLTAKCKACGEQLDLDVDLNDFRQDWRVEDVAFGEARLRLPRPADLAGIEEGAETDLARSLLLGAPPDQGDWEQQAEAALSEADPLADLELRAACPNCSEAVILPLFLDRMLVEELAREATKLMDEIHVLAFAYHWTEPDILAVPESRRRHYLARIQEAWAA